MRSTRVRSVLSLALAATLTLQLVPAPALAEVLDEVGLGSSSEAVVQDEANVEAEPVSDSSESAEAETTSADDEAADVEAEPVEEASEPVDAEPVDTEPVDEGADVQEGDASADAQVTSLEPQAVEAEPRDAEPELQDGTAVIPEDATEADVKEILCAALVANADEVDAQSLDWEYYCTGKNGLLTNDAWGSVNGFTSEKKVMFVPTTFTHPALAENSDGEYQVRLAGTETVVTLTKAAKYQGSVTLNENATVALPYTEDATVDYDALNEKVFDALVSSISPAGLTADDVTIEYYATVTVLGFDHKAWVPLGGGKDGIYTYPSISAGTHQVRISWGGDDTYYGFSSEVTLAVTDRSEAPYTLNNPIGAVTLAVDEGLEVDYDALHEAIFSAVIAESEVLTAGNVTIEYYATAKTGSVGSLGESWMPLEGGTKDLLNYPAISAGTQTVRISWPGNQAYAPTTIEAKVEVQDRPAVTFNLNEGPYEVGMVFADDQSYDYDATARAIFDAVVASTTPELSFEDVSVEYNADSTGITDSFKELGETVLGGLISFGTGEWEIRISWDGNQQYKGGSVTVNVTTTDDRAESSVVLLADASITYNMDPDVMKQALFDSAIDWENSELPAKETLSVDDFDFEYYGEAKLLDGGIDAGSKSWVDVAGDEVTLGDTVLYSYDRMGAGEQQVRITYKGGADYRPSDAAETSVSVEKASVKVSVSSTNVYADEELPEDFVTTDPADDFDVYTIYAGVTSNVTTALYLDLPDRYTESAFLKVLDPVVEKLWGKSFTQMLNDGITVGELRELLSTQELLDLLDKLNIDTGTFGQILSALNSLPSLLDSVSVSFGTPSKAGLYTVVAVTDSENYNTGVGMGFLLVKMRLSGVQLTWNEDLGSSISAADAATFDFGATLSYDGDPTVSQDNVHYLYSGFTSRWRIYSSTTTPPTEPGSYVMTVVTLGGNYQAAPITRTFRITK